MVTDQPVSFGTLLRQYRAAAGLTQEELAERSGLGVRTIAYLEGDRRRTPRIETVLLLANALGLSPEERTYFLDRRRPDEGTLPAFLFPGRAELTPVEPALHPLVGRDAVLGQLDATLQGAGPPVFLLAGEPGIGKSRLLRKAARRAVRGGWTVLAGGSRRRGGEEPYAPLLEALQQHLAGYDPRALRQALTGCAWLVRLLPELADVLEPLPAVSVAPEQERRLMLDAVARLLANVAGPAGSLLVVDDLQWAGQDALDLLALLVGHVRSTVRIVGAYRDTEVKPADPLQLLVTDLARAGLVAHLPLGPLSDAEAASLLDYLLAGGPWDDPELVHRVLERAGGMPFFLVSYAQSLNSGETGTVPWDLAGSIRQRVSLAPDAAEVLGIAAIVGRRVPRNLVLTVAESPEERVLSGLEAACRTRLLVEVGPDAYEFAHDVIREVVEEDLGAARRASLHGRVATALEHDTMRTAPEVLAYHYGRSDTPERSLPYLERAADVAMERYAYSQAESYYRALVERLEGLGVEAEVARIREKLGEPLRRLFRFAEARRVVGAALDWYRGAGDLEGAGRAAALLGIILDKLGESEEAGCLLDEMAQELVQRDDAAGVPSPSTARVWSQLATVHGGQGRYEDMLRAADRAAEIACIRGDDGLRAIAEERRGFALNNLWRLAEAREALERAIPGLEAIGAMPEMVGSIANLAENRRLAGELTEALRLGDRVLEVATQVGLDRSRMNQHLNQAEMRTAVGDWDMSRWHIAQAEELDQTGPTSAYVATILPFMRGELALRTGQWDEAAKQFQLAVARATTNNRTAGEAAQTLLAELALMQGKPAEAQRLLTDLLERPEPNRLLVLPHLAWSHVELGGVRRGLELAQEAERETRERGALLSLPEILRIQGMALSRLGRIMEAESVLTEGRERARAMPLPYTEARILVELALLDRQEGREDRARERLEDALAIVCRLGAAKDAERTEELLAALSCDAPAPSSQNSAGTVSQNWEAPISQYSPAAPSQKSESAMIRLTDAQWGRIAELLPPRRAGRGRPRADDRQTLEAILYIQRTGCAWADLPPELGNHATAHRRWQEWRADGLWDQIVALADRPLPSTAKEQHAGKDAVAPIEQSGGVGHSSLGPQTPHRSDARPSRDL